jgi:hypothetical protein
MTPLIHVPRPRALPRDPRGLISELEASPTLPDGHGERFAGYGVMGVPFRSGHLLAMRRFPGSSVGPGYRSVWHRDPHGRWTFFQDVEPALACTRYFGSAVDEIVSAEIDIDWPTPTELSVTVVGGGHRLDWRIALSSSGATRMLNAIGSVVPDRCWRSPRFLAVMSIAASWSLRTGGLRLAGLAPNGQHFAVNPSLIWLISDTDATLDGRSLGDLGPIPTQAHLADFRIPQRGIFAIGRAFFSAVPTDGQEAPQKDTVQ